MAISLWVAILYSFGTRGVGGIMVSIAAFQAVDPGSIPGRRNFFFYLMIRLRLLQRKMEMLVHFHQAVIAQLGER